MRFFHKPSGMRKNLFGGPAAIGAPYPVRRLPLVEIGEVARSTRFLAARRRLSRVRARREVKLLPRGFIFQACKGLALVAGKNGPPKLSRARR